MDIALPAVSRVARIIEAAAPVRPAFQPGTELVRLREHADGVGELVDEGALLHHLEDRDDALVHEDRALQLGRQRAGDPHQLVDLIREPCRALRAVARGTRVAVRARATRDLLLQRPSIWRATRDLLLQIVDLPPHRARAHAFGVLRPLRAAQCLFDLGAEAIQPHPERPPVGEAAPAATHLVSRLESSFRLGYRFGEPLGSHLVGEREATIRGQLGDHCGHLVNLALTQGPRQPRLGEEMAGGVRLDEIDRPEGVRLCDHGFGGRRTLGEPDLRAVGLRDELVAAHRFGVQRRPVDMSVNRLVREAVERLARRGPTDVPLPSIPVMRHVRGEPTALVVRLDAEQRIHLGVERVDVDAARLEGRARRLGAADRRRRARRVAQRRRAVGDLDRHPARRVEVDLRLRVPRDGVDRVRLDDDLRRVRVARPRERERLHLGERVDRQQRREAERHRLLRRRHLHHRAVRVLGGERRRGLVRLGAHLRVHNPVDHAEVGEHRRDEREEEHAREAEEGFVLSLRARRARALLDQLRGVALRVGHHELMQLLELVARDRPRVVLVGEPEELGRRHRRRRHAELARHRDHARRLDQARQRHLEHLLVHPAEARLPKPLARVDVGDAAELLGREELAGHRRAAPRARELLVVRVEHRRALNSAGFVNRQRGVGGFSRSGSLMVLYTPRGSSVTAGPGNDE